MRTLLLNSILMQENGSFQTKRTCSTLGEFTIRLWLEKEGWTKNREQGTTSTSLCVWLVGWTAKKLQFEALKRISPHQNN